MDKILWSEGIISASGKRVSNVLSQGEWLFFSEVMDYISTDSGILKNSLSEMGQPISSISSLALLLNRKYGVVYKQFNALVRKEVFKEFLTGTKDDKEITIYICNPYFFYRGDPSRTGVLDLFAKTQWAKWNYEDSIYKSC